MGTSVIELINTFQKVNKCKIPYRFVKKREGDTAYSVANNSNSLSLLNWKPKRGLEEMCIDGWKWHCLNPGRLSIKILKCDI